MSVQLDFHHYLPPYRSLLSPNNRYDYKTHSLIPFSSDNDSSIANYINSNITRKSTKSKIKMKYKSLLSDVSRKKSIISIKIGPIANITNNAANSISASASNGSISASKSDKTEKVTETIEDPVELPLTFDSLPIEIIFEIFSHLSFEDHLNCTLVNRQLYQLSKPLLYENLSFISTYRFAQFVTLLRINPTLGTYVKSLDLSNIKPCNYGEEFNDIFPMAVNENDNGNSKKTNNDKIMAGWRDWKFKSNPLYGNSIQLTKTHTNNTNTTNNYSKSIISSNKSTVSLNSAKSKLSSFRINFRKRKLSNASINSVGSSSSAFNQGSSSNSNTTTITRTPPVPDVLNLNETTNNVPVTRAPHHPSINRFLVNYSNSKDLPVGYIIHCLRLCPNLTELNLSNLSLSNDYEIKDYFKYKNYDIKLNYNSNGIAITEIMKRFDFNNLGGENPFPTHNYADSSNYVRANSISKNYLFNFNPFKNSDFDNSSISSNSSSATSSNTITNKRFPKYQSLLSPIQANVPFGNYNASREIIYLSDLNLKSINPKNLRKLSNISILTEISKLQNLQKLNLSSLIWLSYSTVQNFLKNFVEKNAFIKNGKGFEINLKDCGMSRNLFWAMCIKDRDIINKIIRGELTDGFEEFLMDDRARRGRIGENYL